jgi:DNA-dependent RNA polymerase auxiliary subunit epsilon
LYYNKEKERSPNEQTQTAYIINDMVRQGFRLKITDRRKYIYFQNPVNIERKSRDGDGARQVLSPIMTTFVFHDRR